jgi:poly(A) polymerase
MPPFASRLPAELTALAALLARHGARCCLAGGAVRDLCLDLVPADYDLVTDMAPAALAGLFEHVEQRHGRYPVTLLHWQGRVFEATQLPSGAHDPLALDALTRDFRLNSIYCDLATHALVDPVGGLADLAARTVQPIHAAQATIARDPLTMLRAVRVSHRLGFAIARPFREEMATQATAIASVASDRLLVELYRQLTGGRALACIATLRELGILATLWPALDSLFDDAATAAYVDFVLGCLDENSKAGTALSCATVACCLLWGHCLGAARAAQAGEQAERLSRQADPLRVGARFGAGMRQVWLAQFATRPLPAELQAAAHNLRLLRRGFAARVAA